MRRRRIVVGAAAVAALAIAVGWSPAARFWRAGKMLAALSSAHAASPTAAPAREPLIEETLEVAGAGQENTKYYDRSTVDEVA